MREYGDMDYVMSLDFSDGIEIIKESFEQQRKQDHWDIYLTRYPNMDDKNFIPFEKFYRRHDVSRMSAKSVVEKKVDKKDYAMNAIALAEQIRKAHMEQKNSDDLIVERATK